MLCTATPCQGNTHSLFAVITTTLDRLCQCITILFREYIFPSIQPGSHSRPLQKTKRDMAKEDRDRATRI